MTSAASRTINFPGATVEVFAKAPAACLSAADRIAEIVKLSVAARGKAVLGLATGGTPVPVYQRLVELFRAGSISFQDVTTYNLDEYYPISPADPNSYRSYMHRHLLGHVNLAPNRAHLLDGTVPEAFASEHAKAFDRWIAADGGLDFQLLGIGRNGHVAFNEPSDLSVEEACALPTRLVNLHPVTLADAAKDFGDAALVPRRALTMGVAPILAARSILVLAFGPGKAEAVASALTGPQTASCPASLLRTAAGRVTWLIDEPAARGLRD
ncbi:MAG: glucosamine-6-phosphate deaminase [Isosphaeraceae bacterium]